MILCKNCSPSKQCTADKNRTECKYYQPMTNEEWFSGLSTEEKAEFLAKKCCEISCKFFLGEAEEIFSRYWIEWLKKPHTEKE